MVVKITCLEGNGRLNYKFNSSKIKAVYFCIVGITCGRKLRGDEKQLIDLEWPNLQMWYAVPGRNGRPHHFLTTLCTLIVTSLINNLENSKLIFSSSYLSGNVNSVEWNDGMERWSGLLEWSAGLDYWSATPTKLFNIRYTYTVPWPHT